MNRTTGRNWLFAIAFALLVIVPAVEAVTVNINELPVFVRPKDGSGNLIPSTGFSYVFNFTTDSLCSNVLLSRSHYITTDKYGVGFANIDTSPLVGGSIPAYMCEYRDGTLRETHVLNPNVFGEDTGTPDGQGINATQGPYLYDNGVTAFFNETKLNQTIDARDSDTTYTNGTGILLSGTTFLLDLTYLNANFVGQTEYPFLDTNSADDVLSVTGGDGLYNTGTATAPVINVGGGTGIVLAADNISVDNLVVPFRNTAETISGAWVFNNGLTVNGNLNVVGSLVNLTVTQQIINGSIYPDLSGLFDLGSPSALWNTVYANSFIGALDWSNLTGIPGDLDLVASDDITTASTAGGQLSGTFNALSIVPNSVSASQLNLTDITLADFVNDVGYLTGFNETDPYFTAANATLARTGNCPGGEFVVNTTTGGVQCAAPAAMVETDPYWNAEKVNYYNKTEVYNKTEQAGWDQNASDDFNGSWSALSGVPAGFADGIDNDTLYTNGTGLLLSGTTFSLDQTFTDSLYDPLGAAASVAAAVNTTANIESLGFNTTADLDNRYLQNFTEVDPVWNSEKTNYYLKNETYNKSEVYNKTEQANWDMNISDDFNGSFSALTGVPAGFADGVDNDTQYSNLSEFFNDVGYITGFNETDPYFTAANSTLARTGTCPNGTFAVNTTTSGVECAAPAVFVESDPYWNAEKVNYYNKSEVYNKTEQAGWDQNASDDFNGSWSALTGVPAGFADGIDNDTMYTNGTGLLLSGTTFSVDTAYFNSNYASLSAFNSLNATVATNTANIATQTARIDSLNSTKLDATDQRYNDTAAINAVDARVTSVNATVTTNTANIAANTVAINSINSTVNTHTSQIASLNSSIIANTALINAVNTTNNIKSLGFNTTAELSPLFTYFAGTGLVLSSNTFSINGTYLNNSIDARATSSAFNLQNITNNGATTTNRITTGGLNSTANITLTTAGTCLNGASGGFICFNSTHTWIG